MKSGDVIGRLTLIRRVAGKHLGKRNYHWFIKCECGIKKWTAEHSIAAGRTQSCGCYLRHRHESRLDLRESDAP